MERRLALKALAAASTTSALWPRLLRAGAAPITIAGQPVEIAVWSLSATTVRILVSPLRENQPVALATTGALAEATPGSERARQREGAALSSVRAGDLVVRYSDGPPTLHIERRDGGVVQKLTLDAAAPGVSFLLGDGPLLGCAIQRFCATS